MEQAPVIIVGAGLAGSLMAIYLAQKGLSVKVLESRPDMRTTDISAGRSINLALSNRGIKALEEVGLAEQVLKEAVRMPGRMLHDLEGNLQFAPYGKDTSQYINSISRGGLNCLLMDAAEVYPNIELLFNQPCVEVDLEQKIVYTQASPDQEKTAFQASVIIGGDGANSAVRRAMAKQVADFEEGVDWLDHGYKELSIPPTAAGGFALEKNALHIWPRGEYMLIGLPNLDGSFTCTLFFPLKGDVSFESLNEAEKVQEFFESVFKDAVPHLKHLQEEFAHNPVGKLGTLRCSPWIYKGTAALIGDAAHAIVPFYGQGMNASFEDCRVLNACIGKHGTKNWDAVFEAYQAARKINGDAIGTLAVENYYEMRDHVADPVFRKKRQLEHHLENTYSDYHSKYSLVTFHPEVSYEAARSLGNQQDALLMELCKTEKIEHLPVDTLYRKLKSLKPAK